MSRKGGNKGQEGVRVGKEIRATLRDTRKAFLRRWPVSPEGRER